MKTETIEVPSFEGFECVGMKIPTKKDYVLDHRGKELVSIGDIDDFQLCYKKKRWRALKYKTYFTVDGLGEVIEAMEDFHRIDNCRHKAGNYWQTEAEAKESKFYKVWHEGEE
jgi:hypothetical protein